MKPEVVYEDNHLLVLKKPANMPMQADASGDFDLLSWGKAYIKEKYQKPGEVYLGLVHRLDRPVSGLVVLARTSKAAARLTAQVKDRTLRRRYMAVVQGKPQAQGELNDWLLKDEKKNMVSIVRANTPGAKEARLEYRLLRQEGELALVQVQLHTGRSHQIRVQMSGHGWPLWGDNRYGGGKPGQQIALCSVHLELKHPTREERLAFDCEPPEFFPVRP